MSAKRAANGALLTRSEQATSDVTGALGFTATVLGTVRKWTYTRNQFDQVVTVTGPRTDVADVVTYGYDAQHNLTSVSNVLNHVTSMSLHDANGRVKRITAPNGVVTDLAYTPRGWINSRSSSAAGITETTVYGYDDAGQMTSVTLPDGATFSYAYDTAHRLTGITDRLGNSVEYELDLRGNRVGEKIKDPGGQLRLNIQRLYNSLDQLKQTTGGVQ